MAKRKSNGTGRRRRPLTEAERAERRERDRRVLEEATEALQSSEGWEPVRRHNGLGRYYANNQFLLVCEAWARQIELRANGPSLPLSTNAPLPRAGGRLIGVVSLSRPVSLPCRYTPMTEAVELPPSCRCQPRCSRSAPLTARSAVADRGLRVFA